VTAVDAAARVLEERLGLDPTCIGDATLVAAVARRAQSLGLDEVAHYAGVLAVDADEVVRLADEVLVRESWFFRDDKPFALLARFLRERRGARPLRVLSAPCARGEEPYSVAMTLLASGLAPDAFTVDAVDLSPTALDDARRGTYGARALRAAAPPWLDAYVTRAAAGFVVSPVVRQRVTFRHASLLALETLAPPGYDAILCRNALIYLSTAARAAVAETCWRLLAPGGLLIVGHAEAGPLLERGFRRHPEPGAFAFVRRDELLAAAPGPPLRGPGTSTAIGVRPLAAAASATARTAGAAPAPSDGRRDRSVAPAADVAGTGQLAEAQALADRGAYSEAALRLASHLGTRPDDVEAHHLAGIVHAASGDDRAARTAFEKALYLDPAHAPSLVQLALLLETAGDGDGAARLRRRAERQRSPS